MAQIYCLIMVTNQVVNILLQQQLQLSNNWLYHIKMRYFNNPKFDFGNNNLN